MFYVGALLYILPSSLDLHLGFPAMISRALCWKICI